jgi:hypothetical protein
MLRTVDSSIDPTERRTVADWPSGTPSAWRCPACSEPMMSLVVERMPIERCTRHGVWFDRLELERVLSPHVTAESFAVDEQLRQGFADWMEFGSGGLVLRAIWRRIRRRG